MTLIHSQSGCHRNPGAEPWGSPVPLPLCKTLSGGANPHPHVLFPPAARMLGAVGCGQPALGRVRAVAWWWVRRQRPHAWQRGGAHSRQRCWAGAGAAQPGKMLPRNVVLPQKDLLAVARTKLEGRVDLFALRTSAVSPLGMKKPLQGWWLFPLGLCHLCRLVQFGALPAKPTGPRAGMGSQESSGAGCEQPRTGGHGG